MWPGTWGNNRDNESGQDAIPSSVRSAAKNLRVTLSPGFWTGSGTSSTKAETRVVIEANTANWEVVDDACDRREFDGSSGCVSGTPSTSSPREPSRSSSYFPSFSLDYCRRFPGLDFFGGGPATSASTGSRRPQTIPVRMAQPCVLPSTIHGMGDLCSDEGISTKTGMTPDDQQTPGSFKTPDTSSSCVPGDTVTTAKTPSTPSTAGTSHHDGGMGWWNRAINCMAPSSWLVKKQANADSWEIPFERIQDLQWLGSGAQGAVFLGKYNGSFVAVKKVKSLAEVEDVKPLRKLNHPNLVAFKGICSQPPCYCLVMEYCQYGPLYDLIQEDKKIPHTLVASWALQIARGMQHLHLNKIIHRDLKSPNVLVCATDLVKISDFGTMRSWADDQKSMQMSFAGTVAWMAPEVIRNENCTEKIDVWAFGVILWELLVGLHPYPGLDSTSIIWGIGSEKLLGLPVSPSMPDGLKLLQTQCWSVKPRNRPSFAHIISHLEIANRELTSITEQQFYGYQSEWREYTHTEIKNFRIKSSQSAAFNQQKSQRRRLRKKDAALGGGGATSGLSEELIYLLQKRKEELQHAEEVRMHYEEKLQRVNALHSDLTTYALELKDRERELRRSEKLVEKILGKPLPTPERLSRKRILEFVKTAGLELIKPHHHNQNGQSKSSKPLKKQKSATLPMDYAIWTAESSECHTDDPVEDEDATEMYVVGVGPVKPAGGRQESVQLGRTASKEFHRPPLLSLRSKSVDSLNPVNQLKSDDKNTPKLSPDLCRGLPKRTPSDTLGHIFRMSSRRDYACQCNLSAEEFIPEKEEESAASAAISTNGAETDAQVITERNGNNFSPAKHGHNRTARSSRSSMTTSGHDLENGDDDDESDDVESQDDPDDCESSYTQSQHSVFHSEESLRQSADLNPSEQMFRDIVIRRSRERDGGRPASSADGDVAMMHRSVPDLKDALTVSQSLDDFASSASRRASSGEAEDSGGGGEFGQRHFRSTYNDMPESHV
ncbi:Mitogen-activated protein kinase kinase kinase 12 [Hypsibius exemplaris]|uniref:Mitogen-activated protein kinase kinase kinase 12 n=1 Tax=Hypsibius exemplaris TaxID=2072580 RepID=A0A1W0WUS7_HYPEX|nr:Mitogen-activated protein kinase kinase kinase 12 [Hypsibius exemplaris]